jgi:predicted lipid-binding transport protein (Tim44 family)
MNHRFLLVAICAAALCAATAVDAARMGGGRSFGTQRPSVSAPHATPPAATTPSGNVSGPAADPVMPRTAAPPAAPATARAAPGATPPAGASRWLGPLAGIAAGIGIAALLSHFGVSGGFADVLLLALFAFGAVMLARLFMARRFAAAGSDALAAPRAPGDGEPNAGDRFEPRFGGASQVKAVPPHWPPGFDAERFARQAMQQFRAVQRAYDNGDTAALADVMTPELYTETVKDLRSRGVHVPTAFDSLESEVVDVSTEADLYWVSVRFKGLAREDGAAVAQPFDEVWNLSKPVDGSSGWLVAGIQQSVPA